MNTFDFVLSSCVAAAALSGGVMLVVARLRPLPQRAVSQRTLLNRAGFSRGLEQTSGSLDPSRRLSLTWWRTPAPYNRNTRAIACNR